MCGACGRSTETDAWSAALSGRRARWEAARLVNEVLRSSGHPARVGTGGVSFVVRSATGRAEVVDTAGALWRALVRQAGPPVELHPVEDRTPPTEVSRAVFAAARAHGVGTRTGSTRTGRTTA